MLGWRLVPGQQLRYRLTTTWEAADQERMRVEEWTYEVTHVDNRGQALLVGQLSAFGVALDTQGGQLALLPPGAFGIDSRAQVAELSGRTLDEVEEAPSDTLLYAAVQPVPVQLGSVYVIRTRSVAGAFGAKCVYFAKLAPLEIDVTEGRLRFVFEMNPVCNDHQLVPPEYSPE